MKYIRRLQSGGGLMDYVPNPVAPAMSPTQAASSKEAAKASSIIDSEPMKKLIANRGLTNDVNYYMQELKAVEQGTSNPFATKSSRNELLDMVARVNEISNSKESWVKAQSIAKESGGLGELAIGNVGQLYVKTEEGFVREMSVSEYKKSEGKYQALSVAEILQERQTNRQLVGNDKIFDVANNSIGMDKISTHIMKVVHALGSNTSSEEGIRTNKQAAEELQKLGIQLNGRTPNNDELKGIKLLSEVINSPTTYNLILEENSTERTHANRAISYIWSSMDVNAQNKLKAQSALNNLNPEQFILNMLISGTSESYKTGVKPMKDLEEFTPGHVKAGQKEAQINITPQELAHNDRLYKPGRSYSINLGGSETSVTASYVGPLLDLRKSGEVIGTGMVSSLMDNHNYSSIVDKNQAFIGDVKVDQAMLAEVATTGEDIAKVYLPVNPDGSPDLGQMERFSDAYKVFEINRDKWSVKEVKEYFSEKGFNDINITEETTETGQRLKVIGQSSTVKPFMALPVLSNSASDLSDIPWMVKSIGEQKKIDEKLMEKAFTTVGGSVAKPKFVNNMPSGFFSLERPHRGMMFVAYRPEASAILSATQGNIKATPATDLDISRNLNHSNNTNIGKVFGSAEALTQ